MLFDSTQSANEVSAITENLASSLRGVLLPITTPFDSGGEVDLVALRANLRKWRETGVAGYVVLGSTGEHVHLDEQECLRVIETTRAEMADGPGKPSLIAGAGRQSTHGTITEIRRVAAAGADAVLVITPYFYHRAITQQALVRHYLAVADAAPIPVLLYSMPDLTGIEIEPETVAQLSMHPNIVAVKDSSADVTRFSETVKMVQEDFAVLTGNGTVFCEALRAGAWGAILAVGCVVPHLVMEIFRAVKGEDFERAAALQAKLTPLAHAVTTLYGIGGLKAALGLNGYAGGSVRAPLCPPDEAARQEIARLLQEVNSITHYQRTGTDYTRGPLLEEEAPHA
jgi:4-hydroxy-2-oxoglutarate aldolase